jgi:hypothetical protein
MKISTPNMRLSGRAVNEEATYPKFPAILGPKSQAS